MRRPLLGVAILVAFAVLLPVAPAASAARPVSLIEMDSAITPVTVRLLITALDRAQGENAQALIVQLNTPGGLERSMRSMVQSILGAPIPVIVYVAPTGARAASRLRGPGEVDRDSAVHGHREAGHHEEHQEEEHGVDHGDDLDPGLPRRPAAELHGICCSFRARSSRLAMRSIASIACSARAVK